MKLPHRRLVAIAMLALGLGISVSAGAQEIAPIDGRDVVRPSTLPTPPNSGTGSNGSQASNPQPGSNQAANPRASSGASNQANNQSSSQQASGSQPAQDGGSNGVAPAHQSAENTGPLVPNDGRDVQPVTGDLGGAGLGSVFGPSARPAPGGNPSLNPPNGTSGARPGGARASLTWYNGATFVFPSDARPTNQSGMNTGPLVPNDGRDVQPVTGDLGGAGQASTFGPPPPSTSWDGKLSSNPVFGDITIVAPPGAKPTIRFVPAPLRPGELHGLLFGDGKPGENQPEPDQKYQPRPGPTRQGEAPVKAGAIENNNNNNNKRDNSNRETHTERGPGGHSSKTSSNNNPRPASLSASPQQTAKLTEFDTSHMGLASKKTDSAIAKARETAPLTKLDTSHLGTPSSSSTKPTPTPARPQQAGKLTAFDASHMGVAAKLQSFAKPASPTAARTLASQH